MSEGKGVNRILAVIDKILKIIPIVCAIAIGTMAAITRSVPWWVVIGCVLVIICQGLEFRKRRKINICSVAE